MNPDMPLFDESRRLARTDDPSTSHEGALDASKRLGQMQALAHGAIIKHPDRTQMELARLTGTPDRTIGRRVNELCKAGWIVVSGRRACTITGRQAQTYRAKE